MISNKIKVFVVLMVLLLSMLAVVATVQAVPVAVDFVKLDGDIISTDEVIEVDKNSDLNLKVKVLGLADAEDIRLSAEIHGFEHGVITDASDIFDIDAGESRTVSLNMHLPSRMDRDDYLLRVFAFDKRSSLFQLNFNLNIDTVRHGLEVRDVSFSPGSTVQAGRSLLTTVRIENLGEQDEEVKVTVAVPELGLQAADFIDEIESDEITTSEELFIRIPNCAEPGQYTAEIALSYNDDYDTVTEQRTIFVEDGGLCSVEKPKQEKALIAIGQPRNSVAPGERLTYPVTITNTGDAASSFAIDVQGADSWATVEVSPSNVMTLKPGEIKSAFVYLTPKEGITGQQAFNLAINSGDETVQQKTLVGEVDGSAVDEPVKKKSTVRALTIGLIVVIVILIIIGLIVAFSRMKGNDDFEEFEEEGEGQNYY
jgi:uncharacterized membrane protein